MTREDASKLWPLMKAYADGKEVQYLSTDARWRTAGSPSFEAFVKWRIKPAPRELYIHVWNNGAMYACHHPTYEECTEIIRVREVLSDE